MNVTYENNKMVIENVLAETGKKILNFIYETSTEKILPRPVIRDGNGKLIKDHTPRDFFLKLQEEIFEVMETMVNNRNDIDNESITEEIADVITVCISYLNALGYDEKKRSELFARVNEKNEDRGYFKERD